MLGYGTITEDEFWKYLTMKKWKKAADSARIYEIVQDILSVRVNEYMNFATMQAYKLTDFELESEEDRRELLK
jgi:hypothetical protein